MSRGKLWNTFGNPGEILLQIALKIYNKAWLLWSKLGSFLSVRIVLSTYSFTISKPSLIRLCCDCTFGLTWKWGASCTYLFSNYSTSIIEKRFLSVFFISRCQTILKYALTKIHNVSNKFCLILTHLRSRLDQVKSNFDSTYLIPAPAPHLLSSLNVKCQINIQHFHEPVFHPARLLYCIFWLCASPRCSSPTLPLSTKFPEPPILRPSLSLSSPSLPPSPAEVLAWLIKSLNQDS